MEQLTLEHVYAVARTIVLFLIVVAFVMVLYTRQDTIRALFSYGALPAEPIADRPDTPYRDTGDIDQLKPASMDAPQTGVIPSDEALARHLAALTKPSGAHWLSANKIAAAVGGDRATVLTWIREERGQPDPAQPAKRQIALRHNGVEELVEVDW